MNLIQLENCSNDFADKARSIIEKIRILKKNYQNSLLLDKEFHELKTITVEINRHQLKYKYYMDSIGMQESKKAVIGIEF